MTKWSGTAGCEMSGAMPRELDEDRARNLVQEYLDAMAPPGSDVWVITQVVTLDEVWVVGWASRRAAEGSRDPSDTHVGAGPFLVDRRSGRVAQCGSAHPAEHYIQLWRDGQLPDEPPPGKRDPLPGPWFDLRPLERAQEAMAAELDRELAPGHLLHRQPAHALAKCGHCDSVLFALPGGRLAIVHLTWTRKSESPPFPHADVMTEWATALAAMARHQDEESSAVL
jgi:hypothetical protein